MESRNDAVYWINEALTFRNGENLAEQIAMELENGKAGKQVKGNRGRSR